MGNLNSSVSDLVLMALNGDPEAENLKAERKNVLLEQKNNRKMLKQKLGSYRAKMASQGAGALNLEQFHNGNMDIEDFAFTKAREDAAVSSYQNLQTTIITDIFCCRATSVVVVEAVSE